MKTITLKEAYAKATQGPLEIDGSSIQGQWPDFKVQVAAMFTTSFAGKDANLNSIVREETAHNQALLVHAFNVLPEVVAALEELEDALTHSGPCQCCAGSNDEGHEESCRVLIARQALAKANQVKLP